jgi:protocatechuate 3,4-dioxygenase beta subunit
MMKELNSRRLLPAALCLVLGSELAALPQGPPPTPVQAPRDTQPAPALPVGTATLSGTVTVADSGQPARKVRVSLSGAEMRGRTAMTDDAGKFAFIALPAGRYSLSASKPGHVPVSYGQRRPGPGRPGTQIQLADGQKLQVNLQIPRGGVITGMVLDENGEAIPGTQVRALRYAMQSGARVLQQGGSGSTDDRGIYRIYGLQPGEYIIAATPRNTAIADEERMRVELAAIETRVAAMAQSGRGGAASFSPEEMARVRAAASELSQADERSTSGYAPVYYPGTTMAGSAGTVAVGVSEEKSGVDFQLQLVPIARVEGVIVNSNGPMPQNVQVSLVSTGHEVPGVGNSSTRADPNGRFRFSNVAPGQYLLIARGQIGGGRGGGRGEMPAPAAAEAARRAATQQAQSEPVRLWAMTDIAVDGRDVQNLVLTLQQGMTVSGRITFEGTSTVPADLSRLRVNVSPVNLPGAGGEFASNVAGRVDATGRFTVSGVVPGRYRVTASGAQGWRMSSSIVSGQDTLDFPIEVKPQQNVAGVVVTLTDKETELTGAMVNDKGQPAPDYTIVLYAADREFWTPASRRIFSQRPGTDGQFTFRNMPPGDYRIAPVLDPEPGTWFDPAFLQQLDANALRVLIGTGEKKVQNLRISGQ